MRFNPLKMKYMFFYKRPSPQYARFINDASSKAKYRFAEILKLENKIRKNYPGRKILLEHKLIGEELQEYMKKNKGYFYTLKD